MIYKFIDAGDPGRTLEIYSCGDDGIMLELLQKGKIIREITLEGEDYPDLISAIQNIRDKQA